MTRKLRIEGFGSINAQPDMMQFNYEIVQDDASYGIAFDKLTQQYNAAVKTFKKVGFNTALIQTSSINVSIIHETNDRDKVFRCSQRLTFSDKINLDGMSKLLDELRANDDFNFGLSYFIKDTKNFDNDALILAINDANDKAKLIAETSGVKLGHIIDIEYGSGYRGPVMYKAMASDTMGGMNASDLTLSQNVTITWELK